MKIKLWDRLILFLGALLTVASGAILFITGLQLTGTIGEALPMWLRIVCLACGVLTVAFGVYLIVFPRKFSARRHDFIVQQTDNGEVRIAVKAVEGLVQKCIDMHEEIRVVGMRIHNSRDGVTVDMNVALANNISIPLAVASLQKQIKQYLVASSGIEVKEVRVSVETAQDGLAEVPEVEVPEETEAHEQPAEKAAKAPKVPLHQRIFGKPEQPATVPEPPKEPEEAAAEKAPDEPAPAEETPAEAPAEDAAEEEAPAPLDGAAPDTAADEASAEPETEETIRE